MERKPTSARLGEHDARHRRAGCPWRAAVMPTHAASSTPEDCATKVAITPHRLSMAPWHARCLEGYIAAHLHATIRVKDLIKVANCSHFQLKRAFKERFGCTPRQYVMRRRIERAQSLMLIANDSLHQIAAECGFAKPAHLSNLFRKIVGETPRTWRRVHREAAMKLLPPCDNDVMTAPHRTDRR